MTLTREQMLNEMGITPIWRQRSPLNPSPPESNLAVVQESPASIPPLAINAEAVRDWSWAELERGVAACRACRLCEHRQRAVLGVGDRHADWLFIGEGPGAEEDVRGEPFVGQAGKLLDNMLAAIGLQRQQKVYIGNAVKCRPPGNRTPEAEELHACKPFIERQIALIQPKLIVLLGRVAVSTVLAENAALGTLRGKRFFYEKIPVIVTYHPAYLLRNLPEKVKTWEDLLFAQRVWREATAPELPL